MALIFFCAIVRSSFFFFGSEFALRQLHDNTSYATMKLLPLESSLRHDMKYHGYLWVRSVIIVLRSCFQINTWRLLKSNDAVVAVMVMPQHVDKEKRRIDETNLIIIIIIFNKWYVLPLCQDIS